MKKREDVKILIIQFRDDPLIKQKEVSSYAKFMKLQPEQVISHDALSQTVTNDLIDGFDGLIIAGGGNVRTTEDLSIWEGVREIIRYAYQLNFPTLGVCLGIQLAAQAFDGEVTADKQFREIGTLPMHLTEAAKKDPLYQGIPETFNGQMGHNDTVSKLPSGAIHLTYSDKSQYQAFCFQGKKLYFTQYHPELDAEEIRFRFEYYKDHYANNLEEYHSILSSIKESTDASLILERFIDCLVLDTACTC